MISYNLYNPSKSLADRLYTAEFDDALIDQASWKNSRHAGSKLTAQQINKYSPSSSTWQGDDSYQNLPVITKVSTALYIANTVIGGTEDPQFTTIKNHSYVGINKILLINPIDETVQVIDRASEPYQEFHRFITNDFPTGAKAKVKIIDESISTNLQGIHRVKMNKGYLLKSFDFQFAGEESSSLHWGKTLWENNSMYLYKSGSIADNYYLTGSQPTPIATASLNNQLRFRYGMIEVIPGSSAGKGHFFAVDRFGPSFASSSILSNKFTRQYYSGSFGYILHQPDTTTNTMAKLIATTGLGSASRFMGIDSLKFLQSNNADTNLTEQEKTEIHVTFFQGTKDFAPGFNDERSISTFEVDQNLAALGIEQAGICNDGLPTNHELTFKGPNDNRFFPTLSTFPDDFQSGHADVDVAHYDAPGCVPLDAAISSSSSPLGAPNQYMHGGITLDRVDDIDCYVQGGALGEIGYLSVYSASQGTYGDSQLPNMASDNFYSGSFNYEMSFLDKDHTLIMNIDKELELFDGIGDKGLVIIPAHSDPQVVFNLEYYLEKSGILDDTSDNTQQISPNTHN